MFPFEGTCCKLQLLENSLFLFWLFFGGVFFVCLVCLVFCFGVIFFGFFLLNNEMSITVHCTVASQGNGAFRVILAG